MSNRPNYILELKDRTIEFVYVGDESYMSPSGKYYYEHELEDIGATPVPQEEPVVQLVKFWIDGNSPEWANNHKMIFKSHEDAENYRRRCESIGPEWTDWEPKDKELCWSIDPCGAVNQSIWDLSLCGPHWYRFTGQVHPTKERAQEWLDRFGKAWGLK